MNEIEVAQAEKAKARDAVAAAARRGEKPSTFKADDLTWAFAGREDELAALDEVAGKARAAQMEHERKFRDGDKLRRETERVLAEWAKRDELERREKAEAEARRRLGI